MINNSDKNLELPILYVNNNNNKNTSNIISDKYYINLLKKFFSNSTYEQVTEIKDIILGKSKISLRKIEWFVTKYCKCNVVLIDISDKIENKNKEYINDMINIYDNYKSQLKTHKKKYFDPFKREAHIIFNFSYKDMSVETTIGQLNYFKWMIENKILDYIKKHYEFLSKEMYESNKNDCKHKVDKKVKKIVKSQKNNVYENEDIIITSTGFIILLD